MFECHSVRLLKKASLPLLFFAYLIPSYALPQANEFETRAAFPVGPFPASIAVGDFNRDGKLDLAVVSAYNNFVQVLIGNGDGTFQAAVPYATPCIPAFVGVGDFNGDHKPDLIVHYNNGTCRSVAVLLGNGDGTFQLPPIDTFPSIYPAGLGIGDFDGDGKLDVAVAEQFAMTSQVEILTGNGDGSFLLVKTYAVDSEPDAITVADLRNNGKLDLVVPTLGGGTSVLLGNGDGTFKAAVRYLSYAGMWAAVADFNGDGKLDLAVAQLANPPGVSVIFGNGDGTFQATKYYPFGGELRSLGVGDFNRDHKVDLVVPDNLNSVVISVLNTGVVSFSPPTPPNYPFQLVGTTSSPQTVTLTNTGSVALSIASIKVSGPFHARNTCGSSVAPGGSCTITTVFKPTTTGSASGTVTIIDSASSKPQVIYLTGIGTEVSLNPLKLEFAAQKVGTTSAPQTAQVTNTGSTVLHFINIFTGGHDGKDFTESNNCGSHIAGGASCTVTVTFTPKKTGTRNAIVGFSDSGSGSPQYVLLRGSGE